MRKQRNYECVFLGVNVRVCVFLCERACVCLCNCVFVTCGHVCAHVFFCSCSCVCSFIFARFLCLRDVVFARVCACQFPRSSGLWVRHASTQRSMYVSAQPISRTTLGHLHRVHPIVRVTAVLAFGEAYLARIE
jgi:hypothetical protein